MLENAKVPMPPKARYSPRLPADENRDHLMVQVAKAHYELDRTQAEIAADLGLTRWQVAKLLAEARAEGVVRIEITPRAGRRTALEVALQQKWALRDAIVVPLGGNSDPALRMAAVAQAAAQYLANLTPRPGLIGVSWGRSMAAVAQALPPGWNPGAEFVLLNGSTALQLTDAPTGAVTEAFARSAGGSATLLPVPAILGKASTRAALEDDPIIARALARARAADTLCFGMGDASARSILRASGYLSEDDLQRLRALGAVGDILGRFIDAAGQIVDPDLDARTIGLAPAALRGRARSIAIAAGADKQAIAAATLRGGYANVLITDDITAEAVLDAPL